MSRISGDIRRYNVSPIVSSQAEKAKQSKISTLLTAAIPKNLTANATGGDRSTPTKAAASLRKALEPANTVARSHSDNASTLNLTYLGPAEPRQLHGETEHTENRKLAWYQGRLNFLSSVPYLDRCNGFVKETQIGTVTHDQRPLTWYERNFDFDSLTPKERRTGKKTITTVTPVIRKHPAIDAKAAQYLVVAKDLNSVASRDRFNDFENKQLELDQTAEGGFLVTRTLAQRKNEPAAQPHIMSAPAERACLPGHVMKTNLREKLTADRDALREQLKTPHLSRHAKLSITTQIEMYDLVIGGSPLEKALAENEKLAEQITHLDESKGAPSDSDKNQLTLLRQKLTEGKKVALRLSQCQDVILPALMTRTFSDSLNKQSIKSESDKAHYKNPAAVEDGMAEYLATDMQKVMQDYFSIDKDKVAARHGAVYAFVELGKATHPRGLYHDTSLDAYSHFIIKDPRHEKEITFRKIDNDWFRVDHHLMQSSKSDNKYGDGYADAKQTFTPQTPTQYLSEHCPPGKMGNGGWSALGIPNKVGVANTMTSKLSPKESKDDKAEVTTKPLEADKASSTSTKSNLNSKLFGKRLMELRDEFNSGANPSVEAFLLLIPKAINYSATGTPNHLGTCTRTNQFSDAIAPRPGDQFLALNSVTMRVECFEYAGGKSPAWGKVSAEGDDGNALNFSMQQFQALTIRHGLHFVPNSTPASTDGKSSS